MKNIRLPKTSSAQKAEPLRHTNNPATGISLYLHAPEKGDTLFIANELSGIGARFFITGNSGEFNELCGDKCPPDIQYTAMQLNSINQYEIDSAISRAHKILGGIDCAINNFRLPDSSTSIIDCSPDFYNHEFRYLFLDSFLFAKYQVSLMLGSKKGGMIYNLFHTGGNGLGQAAHGVYSLLYAAKGLSESITNSYRDNGIIVQSYLVTRPFINSTVDYSVPPAYSLSGPEGIVPVNNFPDEILKYLREIALIKKRRSAL